MDIRCGSCNKLFRIADEKVSGKAVRFKCSRCGEVITVTADAASASTSAAATPSPASSVVRPAAAPAVPASPPPPPSPEPAPSLSDGQPAEGQASAGLGDFDFREPYEAALNVQANGADTEGHPGNSESLSFDSHPEPDAGGEFSFSENEEKEAESAFQFPTDIISEPVRKAAFSSAPAEDEQKQAAGAGHPGEESVPVLDVSGQNAEPGEREPLAVQSAPLEAPQSVPSASVAEEEEIDLGRALAIPASPATKKEAPKTPALKPAAAAPKEKKAGSPRSTEPSRGTSREPVHPLASGNATGAVAGIGCGVPVALLLLFGFGIMVKMVPLFSGFPVVHLAAVAGTGIFTLGVLSGVVIALIQAQAGRKLFFLVNVVIAALFGAFYGAGMNAVIAFASGKGLLFAPALAGAVSGATTALLLGLAIVFARWMFFGKRSESFGAPVSGLQKTAIALSLVVILGSLYAEGTLFGRMERSGRDIRQRFEEAVTPDGLTVTDAQAYVDPSTGDLVITGKVKNGLDRPKGAWYLVVDVFDQQQKVVATVRMLNGVQLFEKRDFDILSKRGKDVQKAKQGLVLALQRGGIPAKGNTEFEMRLMDPPQGIASFYPVFKKYAFGEKGIEEAGTR